MISWGIKLLKKFGLLAESKEGEQAASENLDLNPGFIDSDSVNEEGKSPLPSPIRKDRASDSEHMDSLSIKLKRKLENIANKEEVTGELDDLKKRKEIDSDSNE
jgi:hypothetical protein